MMSCGSTQHSALSKAGNDSMLACIVTAAPRPQQQVGLSSMAAQTADAASAAKPTAQLHVALSSSSIHSEFRAAHLPGALPPGWVEGEALPSGCPWAESACSDRAQQGIGEYGLCQGMVIISWPSFAGRPRVITVCSEAVYRVVCQLYARQLRCAGVHGLATMAVLLASGHRVGSQSIMPVACHSLLCGC